MRFIFILFILLPTLSKQEVVGQSQVTVIGRGSVEIDPNYAILSIGVRVQDSLPEAASLEMSRRVDLVVDTLVAIGFPRDTMPSKAFDLRTDRDYQNGNKISGYTAYSALEVRSSDLDRLAEIVGAALAAGATELGQIQFGSTHSEKARREALRLASVSARLDAEILAEANGLKLGRLVEILTGEIPQSYERGLIQQTSRVDLPQPPSVSPSALVPQQITIRATVTGVWALEGVRN